jgi:galactoside O-acetyltransferase
MINLIKKIYTKLFYDPVKFAKKHPSIEVDESANILDGARFRINDTNSIKIGKNSLVGAFFNFESTQGKVIIGDNTFIHDGSKLTARSKITIGNYVMISWDCTIMDHTSHSLNHKDRVEDFERLLDSRVKNRQPLLDKCWDKVHVDPIVIHDHVWIGFDSIIMKGVTIGEGSIIGSGSVIRENVPPWSLVIGNPAKVVKNLKDSKAYL